MSFIHRDTHNKSSAKNIARKLLGVLYIASCMVLIMPSCSQTEKQGYELHGQWIEDKYLWLEDMESEKVETWVRNQNLTSRRVLNSLEEKKWLREQFPKDPRYEEGFRHIVKESGRLFYWRKSIFEGQRVYCTRTNKTAREEVLLDPNTWTDDRHVEETYPAPNGKYLLYMETTGGKTRGKIKVINVETKKMEFENLQGPWQEFQTWGRDSTGFYYSAPSGQDKIKSDDENYWISVFYHQMGTNDSPDIKIFYDDHHKDYVHSVYLSESMQYLFLVRTQGDDQRNEIFLKKIDREDGPQPIAVGMDAYYSAYLYNDKLFIQTDYHAPNGQVFVTDVKHLDKKSWQIFLPEQKNVLLNTGFIDGYVYAGYLENACSNIHIYDMKSKYINKVPLLGFGTASIQGNFEGNVYIEYESFLEPKTIYEYNFKTNELQPIKSDVYNDFYNTSDLEVEQIWYPSKDGTPVSMFLIHKQNINKNGTHPVILTGYGGFSRSKVPWFDSYYYFMAKQGVVIALANLRGGGEYGAAWHQAGMQDKKQNTIDDFIGAAEWLINNQYTNPQKLAAYGKSNGGLTVAAAMVQRPELFKVVVCESALLDMLRYQQFNYAELWEKEYGTSENKEQFGYLIRYSPYYNVRINKHYPDVLFTTGKNDTTVSPLHSYKMAAKMQEKNIGKMVLLATYDQVGHKNGGAENTEKSLDGYAFILNKLNVKIKK